MRTPLHKGISEEMDRKIFAEAKRLYKTTIEIGKQLGIDQSTVSRKLRKYGL